MGDTKVVVTDATFDETIKSSDVPILVDFWAEWCTPCKMIAPVLEEMGREYAGRLTVAELDVDANPTISARFQVMSIPTLILFSDGEPKARLVGARGKSELLAELRPHLED